MNEQQAAKLLELLKEISQTLGIIAEKAGAINENMHVLKNVTIK